MRQTRITADIYADYLQAFRRGGLDRVEKYPVVTLVSTLEELESFIRHCS